MHTFKVCFVGFSCLFVMVTLIHFASSIPLQEKDFGQLRFVEQLDRFGVGFGWRNLTCPLCKTLFTILDIALLVRPSVQSQLLLVDNFACYLLFENLE